VFLFFFLYDFFLHFPLSNFHFHLCRSSAQPYSPPSFPIPVTGRPRSYFDFPFCRRFLVLSWDPFYYVFFFFVHSNFSNACSFRSMDSYGLVTPSFLPFYVDRRSLDKTSFPLDNTAPPFFPFLIPFALIHISTWTALL